MAWDIQLENVSGDIVFSPSRDFAGIDGHALLRQQISIRCKIPRGTYIYDYSGTLGSRLHLIPRTPSLAQMEEARVAVIEALQPLEDVIEILGVEVEKTELNQLQVNIQFQPVMTDPDVPSINTSPPDVDYLSVAIPTTD